MTVHFDVIGAGHEVLQIPARDIVIDHRGVVDQHRLPHDDQTETVRRYRLHESLDRILLKHGARRPLRPVERAVDRHGHPDLEIALAPGLAVDGERRAARVEPFAVDDDAPEAGDRPRRRSGAAA
uniref:hypothetical protein n=1 Tax=Nitrospira cf. moscoviensis SBR1015 TaxID=96242 RepID=UPI001180ACED|nr:hypothetical protein [Nitrospira cf. moscoviensis SBR1015]